MCKTLSLIALVVLALPAAAWAAFAEQMGRRRL